MLDLHFSGSADEVIADMKKIMPALIAGTPLPPMQEQPNRDVIVTNTPRSGDKPGSRTRTKKTEEDAKPDAGESNSASQSSKENSDSETIGGEAGGSTNTSWTEIPDIEALRASLKKLGATDGFGADKVFEVLGKYGAKNASTVPEDKRAEVIKAIDDMLAGAK